MITPNDILRFKDRKTPFYFYDLEGLQQTILRAKEAADGFGYHIHYAMKANADDEILKMMLEHRMGVDCVSGAEVKKALEIGFAPDVIAFAGVGKSDDEIIHAIESEIFTLNVESLEELKVIEEIAMSLGKKARVALRLNPDVDAKTHHYITTGLEENKFGISGWQIDEVIPFLRTAKFLELTGLHFHIGSQIQSLEPFRNLCGKISIANERFREAGFQVAHINAGGGLGVNYGKFDDQNDPDFSAFFTVFDQYLSLFPGQSLHFELGRSLVAHCGDLISRVLYVKKGVQTNFLILDAGMTELLRPALYQAVHPIENLDRRKGPIAKYDVVGPVCESSDCFGKAITMAQTERGDLIAIRLAGAYGASMASYYNLRQLNPPIYRK